MMVKSAQEMKQQNADTAFPDEWNRLAVRLSVTGETIKDRPQKTLA